MSVTKKGKIHITSSFPRFISVSVETLFVTMEKLVEKDPLYDLATPKEPKKFPRRVILIVFNEFCERFSYSGMRAFLALYLKGKLFYSDDEATEVYHIFSTMAYFFPLLGAIIADSFLGKYKTILYFMTIYALGTLTLAITAVPPLEIPGREFTILGLMLVSLGTGGIKPCVSAFGGDQFKLPEQEAQLSTFFNLFYFIICLGSLIAKTISPLMRSEIHCFGDKDCYSLAFGAPGVLIISSIILFICAKRIFIIKKPTGNVVLDVIKCIIIAIKNKISRNKSEKKMNHWLDHAKDSYDKNFIADIKQTLRVFLLFTPLPVYWSLLDQLGSRWTLQASKMDGKFSFFTVKPDQMQVLCPCMILILIPIFKKIVYPFFDKCKLFHKPLHKLILGSVLAGIAFICSGLLEWRIEKTYPILPTKEMSQLRIFNGFNCDLEYKNIDTGENFIINSMGFYENKYINVTNNNQLTYNKTINCLNNSKTVKETINFKEKQALSYFFINISEFNQSIIYDDDVAKSRSGFPKIRILTSLADEPNINVGLYNVRREVFEITVNSTKSDIFEVFSGDYYLYVDSKLIPINITLNVGGVYTLLIGKNETEIIPNLIVITEPNSVSMVWLTPQLLIMSASEVLFGITGLEFAFTEAPESMKSVLQAYWYLIEAAGNIIIILVTRLGSNYLQRTQYFFFAILVFFATMIFYILTKRHERQSKEMKQNEGPISYELVMQKTPNSH